jgi:hypothetical protein
VKYTVDGPKDLLSVSGGGLFSTNPNQLILYGGQHTENAKNDDSLSLMTFDIATNHWSVKSTFVRPDGLKPYRFSKGTAVSVPGKEKAFYVGGARVFEDVETKKKEWVYQLSEQLTTIDTRNLDISGVNVGSSVYLLIILS